MRPTGPRPPCPPAGTASLPGISQPGWRPEGRDPERHHFSARTRGRGLSGRRLAPTATPKTRVPVLGSAELAVWDVRACVPGSPGRQTSPNQLFSEVIALRFQSVELFLGRIVSGPRDDSGRGGRSRVAAGYRLPDGPGSGAKGSRSMAGRRPSAACAASEPASGPMVSPEAPRPVATTSPSSPGTGPSSGRMSGPIGRKPTRVPGRCRRPGRGRRPGPARGSRPGRLG